MPDTDCGIAVVGAGIIGLSIACRLAERHENVILIDSSDPGRSCSYGNAGHIATEQVFPLASPATLLQAPRFLLNSKSPLSIRASYALKALPWLMRFALASRPSAFRHGTTALASLLARAMDSLQDLLRFHGLEDQLQTRGHIVIAEKPGSAAGLRNEQKSLAANNVRTKWLAPERVAEYVPELSTSTHGALFFPDSGHVLDPYHLSHGLFSAFKVCGGRFKNSSVRRIFTRPDGKLELQLHSESLVADKVVVAAGAWSKTLTRYLGCSPPLDTERGYHLSAPGWAGNFQLPVASYDRKTIMTPLSTGLRITGFVEFGGLHLPPTPSRFELLEAHLRALLPDSEFPELKQWMGFRPSLPDHLPVIGPSPDNPNAIFAFGHQHLGLTLSGITAEIVTQLIARQTPSIDIHAFRCDRFREQ